MIRTLVAHAAAVGSLIVAVLFDVDRETPLAKLIIVGVMFVVVVILAAWDSIVAGKTRPIRYNGENKDEKARAFMTDLVTKNSGRCAISSNNLSWVTGDALNAMKNKAKDRSLIIVMPQENDISKELQELGADVHYYGADLKPISSRFTIVNFERSGQWAAVSHEVNGTHIIQKVRSGENPILHMAEDLIEMARRTAVEKKVNEKNAAVG